MHALSYFSRKYEYYIQQESIDKQSSKILLRVIDYSSFHTAKNKENNVTKPKLFKWEKKVIFIIKYMKIDTGKRM